MLLNAEREALENISVFGSTKELNSQTYFKVDEGIAGSVFKTGKGELINSLCLTQGLSLTRISSVP